MPKIKTHLLNNARIKNSPFLDKDYTIPDGGGLYLFVRTYKQKEWFFRFTSPLTGLRRKQSLGRYPDISLQQARKVAAYNRSILDQKQDPLFETEKGRREKEEEHKTHKQRERYTVEAVFQMWKQADLQNRKDGGTDTERAFIKDVFPVIGRKPISDITRQDIRDVLDRPLSRKSKRMANRLLSDLKQFFGYAQDEELTEIDPTRRMFKSRVGGIEKSRERVLSKDEMEIFAQKLLSSDLPDNYQQGIWLMLATGCRVDEISRAEWSHVDYNAGTLTIPVEHAKNKTQHKIYLSQFALQQLRLLEKEKNSEWIFPNRTSTGPIHRQTISKQIADRQRTKKIKGRTKQHDSLTLIGPRWTAHDLRRTAATLMQELGIMPYIIKKCMNQKIEDRLMETYQRAELVEMQKEAFDKLGNYLSEYFTKIRAPG